MAEDTSRQEFCIACACDVLRTLRDAALSCELVPLSTLLQNALEEAGKLGKDGDAAPCTCETPHETLVDTILQKGEAMQLLEFVSAIAMLDDKNREELASELEAAQVNNLLDQIH